MTQVQQRSEHLMKPKRLECLATTGVCQQHTQAQSTLHTFIYERLKVTLQLLFLTETSFSCWKIINCKHVLLIVAVRYIKTNNYVGMFLFYLAIY